MSIERASQNDVMELVCDVTGTSMQVAAVLVLLPPAPLELAAVRAAIGSRIAAVPRLRQRLADTPFGCGRPVWIDDPGFDIGDHVTATDCATPGDERALLDTVAAIITRRLPVDRPLWSATLITSLACKRAALVLVLHHVLADGIGGLAVLARLVDGVPMVFDPAYPRQPARPRELFADAMSSRLRAIRRLPVAVGRLGTALRELGAGQGGHPPRSSLNRPIGTSRMLGVARADLAAVRAAGHSRSGTVNDVVLTAVSGGLATVLAARGEFVDRLVVSVPVSARRHTTDGQLGNQVGVLPVEVPVTGAPIERLAAVARITRQRKTITPGSSAALIGPAFRVLAKAGVFGWFIARQRLINTFLSNLRGPEQRLSFLGAPVTEMIPVGGISGNVTVAFTALSYAGQLVVTVIADPVHCPDLPDVVHAVQQQLRALTAGQGSEDPPPERAQAWSSRTARDAPKTTSSRVPR